MRETTDPDLIAFYAEGAAKRNFKGLTILQHVESIEKVVRRTRAQTVLDYGSGQGKAWSRGLTDRLGLSSVTCYDPAVPRFAQKPEGRFDGVICCDVLEHIGEEHIDAVIEELFGYARKFVWASVCCRPAKKTLPDGRNAHVTIRPYAWWGCKFGSQGVRSHKAWTLIETP